MKALLAYLESVEAKKRKNTRYIAVESQKTSRWDLFEASRGLQRPNQVDNSRDESCIEYILANCKALMAYLELVEAEKRKNDAKYSR